MLSRLEIWNLLFIQLESVNELFQLEEHACMLEPGLLQQQIVIGDERLIATFFFCNKYQVTIAMKLCMHKPDQPCTSSRILTIAKNYKININYKYERIMTVYYNMRARFHERSCILQRQCTVDLCI